MYKFIHADLSKLITWNSELGQVKLRKHYNLYVIQPSVNVMQPEWEMSHVSLVCV